MTAIMLFRRDLRLADNAALTAACQEHEQVMPLYVHEPASGEWAPGGASRWWLHHSLAALQAQFAARGGSLTLCRGSTLRLLPGLCQKHGVDAVYWNRCYEPEMQERDGLLEAALRRRGIAVQSHAGALWREPSTLLTQEGGPYRVFTPYWRKLHEHLQVRVPLPMPRGRRWLASVEAQSLESLGLLPRIAWHGGLAEMWQPGEAGAHRSLKAFSRDALGRYSAARDLPGESGTSRLSPHLHFGEITPGQIHYALASKGEDAEPFLRQLGWREFAHYLLFHFPHTPTRNFNPRFDAFSWAAPDAAALERWRRGRTGIPLVDAGMRELWHTGWMHNRVRMVVASFLTKNLRLHWSHGARWFWDTLVDADLANNTLGWQWVAGSGADAAPYFRVFNPVTQARKFDPEGVYLRRWLPELAGLPAELLHEPWRDPAVLRRSGYPEPMVDLAASRQAALATYQALP